MALGGGCGERGEQASARQYEGLRSSGSGSRSSGYMSNNGIEIKIMINEIEII